MIIRELALLGLVLALGAPLASAGEEPATAATTAAASGADADQAKEQQAKKDAEEKRRTDEAIKQLRTQGYKPETRKGVVYYCRNEAPLGSRFEQKNCAPLDVLVARTQNGKDMTESIRLNGLHTQGSN